jgi:SWI/SNF chromatin-remodeling complex subunit SWI1
MQPVARVLQHYYQVILGNFEELYRKNVVEQQRKALLMRSGAAPQAPGGGIGQTPQQAGGVNGNLQPGQQDTAGVTNGMGMIGQPISSAQPSGVPTNSGSTFPLQPPPQSDHQRQPSATPSMLGGISNDGTPNQTSIGGYPAQAAVKIASETEQDGLTNKRKLESEEVDIKRARQKTGQHPLFIILHVD